jgi:ABC-2 type transport system ATP-binding protein
VGPDGAGKTTAIRLVAGLLDVQSGRVRVLGDDPGARGSKVREAIGYMPQRYSLYGDLSVAENLSFFGQLFCLDRAAYRERSARLLAITRLERFVDRRADALSGGMYKKLALACALLHRPRVLLLDEPTNGVDPPSRAELWDLLYEFAHDGMAIAVSTSYMDEAARCARVGLAHRGRLVLEGRPSDLVASFGESVLVVHETSPAIEALVEAAGTDVFGVAPHGGGLRIVLRRAASDRLVASLGAAGGRVERARPGFEDVFLARIRGDEEAGHAR